MKRLLFLLFLPLFGYSLFYFCHKQTGGFQLYKIYSSIKREQKWEISHSNEEISDLQKCLQIPFYFLGKGGQAYAFLSEDGKTVLKLFKMHNLYQYPLFYKLSLPFPYEKLRLKLLVNQKKKLDRLFSSSLLAYKLLKEESALLYMNLNENPSLASVTVTLVDKLGIRHKVNLSHIPFAVQKRGERAFKALERSLQKGDVTSAKELIDKIVLQIETRRTLQMGDFDPCVRRNLGFLEGGTPFFIDIGGFFSKTNEPLCPLGDELASLREWLGKHSPELATYLDAHSQPNSL